MKRRVVLLALAADAAIGAAHPRTAPLPRLLLPLDCRFGETCFVQNYLDDDTSANVRDFAGGHRSYDGHNGVDIRVPSMVEQRAGMTVRAAAAGRVLRMRDGVADVSVADTGPAAVKGEECGNGLVIDHGGGWETQYCHLARGSLRVRPGQRVKAGAPLGRVGLSGDTEFPHVHLSVRWMGRVVDPFAWCEGAAPHCAHPRALWKERLGYQAGQAMLVGFATHVVNSRELMERGAAPPPLPTRTGAPLIAFGEAIGLARGDVLKLSITGPDGRVFAEGASPPLPRDQAVYVQSVGRKPRAEGFPVGVYTGRFAVERDGAEVILRTFQTRL